MKLKNTKKSLIAAASLFTLPGLVGCNITSPLDGVEFKFQLEKPAVRAALQVEDGSTGEPVNANVTLQVRQGDMSAKMIDLLGKTLPAVDGEVLPTATLVVPEGAVSFGLTGQVPTEEAPIEVHVLVTADGYLPTSRKMTLTDADNEALTIQMVGLSVAPAGVTSTVVSNAYQTLSNGVVQSTATVTTPASEVGGTAQVTIPAGTTVLDSAGNPLTGNVTATVAYFSNTQEESLAAFPGGFDVDVDNQPTEPEGQFFTAGFVAVEMHDGSGKQATTFQGAPIQVTVTVPGTTIHPTLERPVQAGDTVPYWSYNNQSGTWNYEGDATLTGPDVNGNFTGVMMAQHLSYWNLDFLHSKICKRTQPFVLEGARGEPVVVRVTDTVTGQTIDSTPKIKDGVITFGRAPKNRAMKLRVYQVASGELVGSLNVSNICDGGTIPVTLAETVRMSFDVSVKCGDVTVRPWGAVTYWPKTSLKQRVKKTVWVEDGKATVDVLPDREYVVTASGAFKGKARRHTVTVKTSAEDRSIVKALDLTGKEGCE